MSKKDAKKRIDKLRQEIDHHRYNYHVLDKESIAPAALDSLKNELFKLESEFPEFITKDSPTQRVAGKPLDKFEKIRHSVPMISLFDAFSEEDMRDWEKRNENYLKSSFSGPYYCELKLDGLAISLRYEASQLVSAATRGDGKVGENVTLNVKTIQSVPLSLRIPKKEELEANKFSKKDIEIILDLLEKGEIEIRGEAIMSTSVFEELNKQYKKEGKAQLANTRNAVAGSIRQLDAKVAASRKLDFYSYDLLLPKFERGEVIDTKEKMDKLVKLLGFKVLPENKVCSNLEQVFSFYDKVEEKRDDLLFEIDGVVVKVNDLSMWPKLGIVGKAPRYMMAYKFSAEQATTKVLDIVWQVGRTGTLTPTAVLEPVKVGGATISRSTLHNFDEIKRLDLKLGDTVIIERSGDVIPKVIEVLKNLRTGKEEDIHAPKTCPRCKGKVEKVPGEVAYRCTNKDCYAVSLRQISHFVSKGAADFAGLGPKLIEQFMDAGLIKDPADLYSLKKSDLLSLERFAEKKADNIIELIENKKELDLARFIYALGIRHVGEETAMMLATDLIKDEEIYKKSEKDNRGGEHIIYISDVIDFFQKKDKEEFKEMTDIGPVMASSIYDYWRNEKNLKFLKKLEERGVKLKTERSINMESSSALEGKSFVITGSLSSLTRQEAKDKIKTLGGKSKSSVSQNTDYLVYGDSPGSKYEEAKKLGVEILSEEDFLKLIKEN